MDIEKIKDYSEELKDIADKQLKASREYIKARRKFASTLFDVKFALSKKIMEYREQRKNIGIEMAIIEKLRENDESFNEAYKANLFAEADYKGYEQALNALNSQAIGIQAIMKWSSYNEKFNA